MNHHSYRNDSSETIFFEWGATHEVSKESRTTVFNMKRVREGGDVFIIGQWGSWVTILTRDGSKTAIASEDLRPRQREAEMILTHTVTISWSVEEAEEYGKHTDDFHMGLDEKQEVRLEDLHADGWALVTISNGDKGWFPFARLRSMH